MAKKGKSKKQQVREQVKRQETGLSVVDFLALKKRLSK